MKKISIIAFCFMQSACILKPLESGVGYLKDKSNQCNAIVDIYIPRNTSYDKIKAITNAEICAYTVSFCENCHTSYIRRDEYKAWAKEYKKLGLKPPFPKKTGKYNIFPPKHKRNQEYTIHDFNLLKKIDDDNQSSIFTSGNRKMPYNNVYNSNGSNSYYDSQSLQYSNPYIDQYDYRNSYNSYKKYQQQSYY